MRGNHGPASRSATVSPGASTASTNTGGGEPHAAADSRGRLVLLTAFATEAGAATGGGVAQGPISSRFLDEASRRYVLPPPVPSSLSPSPSSSPSVHGTRQVSQWIGDMEQIVHESPHLLPRASELTEHSAGCGEAVNLESVNSTTRVPSTQSHQSSETGFRTEPDRTSHQSEAEMSVSAQALPIQRQTTDFPRRRSAVNIASVPEGEIALLEEQARQIAQVARVRQQREVELIFQEMGLELDRDRENQQQQQQQ
ncbi:hypothetical protein HDU84_004118 [Entophlyctis sp. JEL0112]|nr:hypothetical protein HDU84_004118 [Entophlyctis sp. JEL0112]